MKSTLWIPLIPGLVIAAIALAVFSSPIAPQADPQASLDALEAIRTRRKGTVPPGSNAERDALDRFRALFSDFTPDGLASNTPHVYAESLFFNDTVKTITTRDELTRYLVHSAEAVTSCEVEFLQEIRSDDDFFFHWLMTIQFRGSDRGKGSQSAGITHIRFDENGNVIYHQDYWDSATGLYQHLPVIGWLIRKIRARL